jgi:ATP-binding cassette subfamily B multidrug efflux pump
MTTTFARSGFIYNWINRYSLEAADNTSLDPANGLYPASVRGFMWHFIKPLKIPLFVLTGIYALAQTLVLTEAVFIGQIVGKLADKNLEAALMLLGGFLIVTQIIARLMFLTGHKVEAFLFPLITSRIRLQLGNHVKKHSYRFFQDDFAGRLSGKVIEMPQSIMMIIFDLVGAFLMTLLSLAFTLIVLFTLHWSFGLIATIYAVVFCYTIFVKSPQLNRIAETVAKSRNVMRGHFIDSISNILLVKTFARERHEQLSLRGDLETVTGYDQSENLVFRTLGIWQHLNNALLQVGSALLAIYGWQQGWFDVGTIATALPMAAVMASSAWWLLHTSGMFFTRLGEIREGVADLNKPIEITDIAAAQPLKVATPSIEFRDVTFTYPGRPVFENFSLTIPAHQKVGLIGPSGAGKSTLAQLLLRLHDLQQGQILIDGHSIADVTQTSLREHIAFIPQSSDLLHRTIADNLRYGKLDASEEDMIRAAKLAHAHDFILDLQDKDGNRAYQSLVGERGVKLSGGQRQRIAIARAALKDAPILLLDEATSALDSQSEKLIQDSLKDLMKGRTVLVIAHRLSTIAHLDRLIVIDKGLIVEDGSHEELIQKGGLYARLWNLQSAGFLGDAV